MPVQYPTHFARLGAVPDAWLPALPLAIPQPDGGLKSLGEHFFLNSGSQIALQPDFSRLIQPGASSLAEVWGVDLHPALAALTGNSADPSQPMALGVLFGPVYGPRPDVLGVMFDLGVDDPHDPGATEEDRARPREGCAVLIGAIAAEWLPDAAQRLEYERQVAYAVVHEIGHIFNLQHLTPPPHTFMDNLAGSALFDSWFRFQGLHTDQLRQCGEDKAVTPGQNRFGVVGEWGNILAGRRPRVVERSVLRLDVAIDQREFWPWEPVELDITLTAGSRKGLRLPHVPDELDPGYRSFEIWIEEPSGERRRYRATKHYCAPPSRKKISHELPIQRDVSIFFEAGRYAFRQPGRHKVWATFRISRGLELRSDPCEIEIRSRRGCSKRERDRADEARKLLTAALHTLYYRSGRPRRAEVAALKTFAQRFPTAESAASALYALGCLFCPRPQGKPRRPDAARAARDFLERAIQHDGLSTHRRRRAVERQARLPKAR